MPFITVNGVALPTPSEFSVGIYDISKAERNANGLMLIERITTKKKLSLKWAVLNNYDAKTVLKAVESTFYDVTYTDPVDNVQKTGSFYCGDRNLGMIDYINGFPRYKELSFDLIER
jgi:hypothetical protein